MVTSLPENETISGTSGQTVADHVTPSCSNESSNSSSKSRKTRQKRKRRSSSTGGGGSLLRAARAGNTEKVIALLDQENVDISTCNSTGLTALHLAAKEGHRDIVKALLERGASPNQASKMGNTGLHITCLAGKLEVVKLLVEHEADVNALAQNSFTPLYMASQEGHVDIVDYLLKHGASNNISTKDGFTPLAVALQEGRDGVVALLLEKDDKGRVKFPPLHIAAKKDDAQAAILLLQNENTAETTAKMSVNKTSESGFTALHIAAHYGNLNVAEVLLNRGAMVDFKAKNGVTPMHVAAKRGHTRFCSLLLERHGRPDICTRDGLIPLHCAARSGHFPIVKLFLENEKTPKFAKTKNGLSVLHMAAQGGYAKVIELLLDKGYAIDDVTSDYLSALHIASHCGHVDVVRLLLKRKAYVDCKALNGFTSLHVACKKNRHTVVELLLAHGANKEALTESGLTALHINAFMGHLNIVELLLRYKVELDAVNVRGETALHMATRAGQTNIVTYLLSNGAKPDARKKESQTCLHLAARLDKHLILKILIEHGAVVDETTEEGYTPLHVAAKEGHVDICETLLDNNASVDLKTKKGFIPLHLAAKYGQLETANLLLKRGSTPDANGKDGLTPLHVAAHYDNQQVALLLLKNGASPHSSGKNGYTPLHIAARKNQMEMAVTLLEYGASPNSKTRMGVTPLHIASQEGHTDLCSLLLSKDAAVNAGARHGLTPMHLAAQENRVSVAKILHNNGSLVDPLTKSGCTPLHIAAHHGNIDIANYLLSLGAKVNAKTKTGYTPLHQAAQQGHTHIVNLLLKYGASPNDLTNNGNTAFSLAKRLGYVTIVDVLQTVTTETTTTVTEEKPIPETVNEGFISDASDDEGDESTSGGRFLTSDEMKELGDDSIVPTEASMFAVSKNARYATLDQSSVSTGLDRPRSWSSSTSDNDTDSKRSLRHGGFLVSFMVDARGGTMRASRHPDMRVLVPPKACRGPTRVTCRLARRRHTTALPPPATPSLFDGEGRATRVVEIGPVGGTFLDRLHCPRTYPPLTEGEGLAARVLQLAPKLNRFLGPVAVELPYYANVFENNRQLVVLRSNDGETWKPHDWPCSDLEFRNLFKDDELASAEELTSRKVLRIITKDFPRYFAVVTRPIEDPLVIGPSGGELQSSVLKSAKVRFPEGSLTKKITVSMQVMHISSDACRRAVGGKAKASSILTIEPRRRKFHKPITLTIPLPDGADMKDYLSSSEDSTLRLLCSISGGSDPAQWEDITVSTPLNFLDNCASFTSTVSARFWLIDCRQPSDSSVLAHQIYNEATRVPYMARFVVYAKSHDPLEAKMRVFCLTDDKYERTLETQENFEEIARSKDIEMFDGSSFVVECSGNLSAPLKSGQQHQCVFTSFEDNRFQLVAKVRDSTQDHCGRLTFYCPPLGNPKTHGPRKTLCSLNVRLPDYDQDTDYDSDASGTSEEAANQRSATLAEEVAEATRRYFLVDPSTVGLSHDVEESGSSPEEISRDVGEVVKQLNQVKLLLKPDAVTDGSDKDNRTQCRSAGDELDLSETTVVVEQTRSGLVALKEILESGDELEREEDLSTLKPSGADDTKRSSSEDTVAKIEPNSGVLRSEECIERLERTSQIFERHVENVSSTYNPQRFSDLHGSSRSTNEEKSICEDFEVLSQEQQQREDILSVEFERKVESLDDTGAQMSFSSELLNELISADASNLSDSAIEDIEISMHGPEEDLTLFLACTLSPKESVSRSDKKLAEEVTEEKCSASIIPRESDAIDKAIRDINSDEELSHFLADDLERHQPPTEVTSSRRTPVVAEEQVVKLQRAFSVQANFGRVQNQVEDVSTSKLTRSISSLSDRHKTVRFYENVTVIDDRSTSPLHALDKAITLQASLENISSDMSSLESLDTNTDTAGSVSFSPPNSDSEQSDIIEEVANEQRSVTLRDRVLAYQAATDELHKEVEIFRILTSPQTPVTHEVFPVQSTTKPDGVSPLSKRRDEEMSLSFDGEPSKDTKLSEDKELSPVVIEESHSVSDLLKTWEKGQTPTRSPAKKNPLLLTQSSSKSCSEDDGVAVSSETSERKVEIIEPGSVATPTTCARADNLLHEQIASSSTSKDKHVAGTSYDEDTVARYGSSVNEKIPSPISSTDSHQLLESEAEEPCVAVEEEVTSLNIYDNDKDASTSDSDEINRSVVISSTWSTESCKSLENTNRFSIKQEVAQYEDETLIFKTKPTEAADASELEEFEEIEKEICVDVNKDPLDSSKTMNKSVEEIDYDQLVKSGHLEDPEASFQMSEEPYMIFDLAQTSTNNADNNFSSSVKSPVPKHGLYLIPGVIISKCSEERLDLLAINEETTTAEASVPKSTDSSWQETDHSDQDSSGEPTEDTSSLSKYPSGDVYPSEKLSDLEQSRKPDVESSDNALTSLSPSNDKEVYDNDNGLVGGRPRVLSDISERSEGSHVDNEGEKNLFQDISPQSDSLFQDDKIQTGVEAAENVGCVLGSPSTVLSALPRSKPDLIEDFSCMSFTEPHSTSTELHSTSTKLHSTSTEFHSTSSDPHSTSTELCSTSTEFHSTSSKPHSTSNEPHSTSTEFHSASTELQYDPVSTSDSITARFAEASTSLQDSRLPIVDVSSADEDSSFIYTDNLKSKLVIDYLRTSPTPNVSPDSVDTKPFDIIDQITTCDDGILVREKSTSENDFGLKIGETFKHNLPDEPDVKTEAVSKEEDSSVSLEEQGGVSSESLPQRVAYCEVSEVEATPLSQEFMLKEIESSEIHSKQPNMVDLQSESATPLEMQPSLYESTRAYDKASDDDNFSDDDTTLLSTKDENEKYCLYERNGDDDSQAEEGGFGKEFDLSGNCKEDYIRGNEFVGQREDTVRLPREDLSVSLVEQDIVTSECLQPAEYYREPANAVALPSQEGILREIDSSAIHSGQTNTENLVLKKVSSLENQPDPVVSTTQALDKASYEGTALSSTKDEKSEDKDLQTKEEVFEKKLGLSGNREENDIPEDKTVGPSDFDVEATTSPESVDVISGECAIDKEFDIKLDESFKYNLSLDESVIQTEDTARVSREDLSISLAEHGDVTPEPLPQLVVYSKEPADESALHSQEGIKEEIDSSVIHSYQTNSKYMVIEEAASLEYQPDPVVSTAQAFDKASDESTALSSTKDEYEKSEDKDLTKEEVFEKKLDLSGNCKEDDIPEDESVGPADFDVEATVSQESVDVVSGECAIDKEFDIKLDESFKYNLSLDESVIQTEDTARVSREDLSISLAEHGDVTPEPLPQLVVYSKEPADESALHSQEGIKEEIDSSVIHSCQTNTEYMVIEKAASLEHQPDPAVSTTQAFDKASDEGTALSSTKYEYEQSEDKDLLTKEEVFEKKLDLSGNCKEDDIPEDESVGPADFDVEATASQESVDVVIGKRTIDKEFDIKLEESFKYNLSLDESVVQTEDTVRVSREDLSISLVEHDDVTPEPLPQLVVYSKEPADEAALLTQDGIIGENDSVAINSGQTPSANMVIEEAASLENQPNPDVSSTHVFDKASDDNFADGDAGLSSTKDEKEKNNFYATSDVKDPQTEEDSITKELDLSSNHGKDDIPKEESLCQVKFDLRDDTFRESVSFQKSTTLQAHCSRKLVEDEKVSTFNMQMDKHDPHNESVICDTSFSHEEMEVFSSETGPDDCQDAMKQGDNMIAYESVPSTSTSKLTFDDVDEVANRKNMVKTDPEYFVPETVMKEEDSMLLLAKESDNITKEKGKTTMAQLETEFYEMLSTEPVKQQTDIGEETISFQDAQEQEPTIPALAFSEYIEDMDISKSSASPEFSEDRTRTVSVVDLTQRPHDYNEEPRTDSEEDNPNVIESSDCNDELGTERVNNVFTGEVVQADELAVSCTVGSYELPADTCEADTFEQAESASLDAIAPEQIGDLNVFHEEQEDLDKLSKDQDSLYFDQDQPSSDICHFLEKETTQKTGCQETLYEISESLDSEKIADGAVIDTGIDDSINDGDKLFTEGVFEVDRRLSDNQSSTVSHDESRLKDDSIPKSTHQSVEQDSYSHKNVVAKGIAHLERTTLSFDSVCYDTDKHCLDYSFSSNSTSPISDFNDYAYRPPLIPQDMPLAIDFEDETSSTEKVHEHDKTDSTMLETQVHLLSEKMVDGVLQIAITHSLDTRNLPSQRESDILDNADGVITAGGAVAFENADLRSNESHIESLTSDGIIAPRDEIVDDNRCERNSNVIKPHIETDLNKKEDEMASDFEDDKAQASFEEGYEESSTSIRSIKGSTSSVESIFSYQSDTDACKDGYDGVEYESIELYEHTQISSSLKTGDSLADELANAAKAEDQEQMDERNSDKTHFKEQAQSELHATFSGSEMYEDADITVPLEKKVVHSDDNEATAFSQTIDEETPEPIKVVSEKIWEEAVLNSAFGSTRSRGLSNISEEQSLIEMSTANPTQQVSVESVSSAADHSIASNRDIHPQPEGHPLEDIQSNENLLNLNIREEEDAKLETIHDDVEVKYESIFLENVESTSANEFGSNQSNATGVIGSDPVCGDELFHETKTTVLHDQELSDHRDSLSSSSSSSGLLNYCYDYGLSVPTLVITSQSTELLVSSDLTLPTEEDTKEIVVSNSRPFVAESTLETGKDQVSHSVSGIAFTDFARERAATDSNQSQSPDSPEVKSLTDSEAQDLNNSFETHKKKAIQIHRSTSLSESSVLQGQPISIETNALSDSEVYCDDGVGKSVRSCADQAFIRHYSLPSPKTEELERPATPTPPNMSPVLRCDTLTSQDSPAQDQDSLQDMSVEVESIRTYSLNTQTQSQDAPTRDEKGKQNLPSVSKDDYLDIATSPSLTSDGYNNLTVNRSLSGVLTPLTGDSVGEVSAGDEFSFRLYPGPQISVNSAATMDQFLSDEVFTSEEFHPTRLNSESPTVYQPTNAVDTHTYSRAETLQSEAVLENYLLLDSEQTVAAPVGPSSHMETEYSQQSTFSDASKSLNESQGLSSHSSDRDTIESKESEPTSTSVETVKSQEQHVIEEKLFVPDTASTISRIPNTAENYNDAMVAGTRTEIADQMGVSEAITSEEGPDDCRNESDKDDSPRELLVEPLLDTSVAASSPLQYSQTEASGLQKSSVPDQSCSYYSEHRSKISSDEESHSEHFLLGNRKKIIARSSRIPIAKSDSMKKSSISASCKEIRKSRAVDFRLSQSLPTRTRRPRLSRENLKALDVRSHSHAILGAASTSRLPVRRTSLPRVKKKHRRNRHRDLGNLTSPGSTSTFSRSSSSSNISLKFRRSCGSSPVQESVFRNEPFTNKMLNSKKYIALREGVFTYKTSPALEKEDCEKTAQVKTNVSSTESTSRSISETVDGVVTHETSQACTSAARRPKNNNGNKLSSENPFLEERPRFDSGLDKSSGSKTAATPLSGEDAFERNQTAFISSKMACGADDPSSTRPTYAEWSCLTQATEVRRDVIHSHSLDFQPQNVETSSSYSTERDSLNSEPLNLEAEDISSYTPDSMNVFEPTRIMAEHRNVSYPDSLSVHQDSSKIGQIHSLDSLNRDNDNSVTNVNLQQDCASQHVPSYSSDSLNDAQVVQENIKQSSYFTSDSLERKKVQKTAQTSHFSDEEPRDDSLNGDYPPESSSGLSSDSMDYSCTSVIREIEAEAARAISITPDSVETPSPVYPSGSVKIASMETQSFLIDQNYPMSEAQGTMTSGMLGNEPSLDMQSVSQCGNLLNNKPTDFESGKAAEKNECPGSLQGVSYDADRCGKTFEKLQSAEVLECSMASEHSTSSYLSYDQPQTLSSERTDDTLEEDSFHSTTYGLPSDSTLDQCLNPEHQAVAAKIGLQWPQLAGALGLSSADVWRIQKQCDGTPDGTHSKVMMKLWLEQHKETATVDRLRTALSEIDRGDLITLLQEVTLAMQQQATPLPSKTPHDDNSVFHALSSELGSPYPTPGQHISSPFPFPAHKSTLPTSTPTASKAQADMSLGDESLIKTPPNTANLPEMDDPNQPHFVYGDYEEAEATNKKDDSSNEDQQDKKSSSSRTSSVASSSTTSGEHMMKDEEKTGGDSSSDDEAEAVTCDEEPEQNGVDDVNTNGDVEDNDDEVDGRQQVTENVVVDRHDNGNVTTTVITRTIVVETENPGDFTLPSPKVEVSHDGARVIEISRQVVQKVISDSSSSEQE